MAIQWINPAPALLIHENEKGLRHSPQALDFPSAPARTRTQNNGIGIRRYIQFNYRSSAFLRPWNAAQS